jgi:hypothetical protein
MVQRRAAMAMLSMVMVTGSGMVRMRAAMAMAVVHQATNPRSSVVEQAAESAAMAVMPRRGVSRGMMRRRGMPRRSGSSRLVLMVQKFEHGYSGCKFQSCVSTKSSAR